MHVPSIGKFYLWFYSLVLCLVLPKAYKKRKARCAISKKFRKRYSLFLKYKTLSTLSHFFGAIDDFSEKHPFLAQSSILMFSYFLAVILYEINVPNGSKEELGAFVSLLSKGFFIAPLITLMVSNQKAIVNHFVAIFFYNKDFKETEINKNIDKDGIAYRHDSKIREMMIRIVYTHADNKDKDLDSYIKFTRRMIQKSVEARDGNDYRNAATLILSGTALMVGFFLLLFGWIHGAMAFLFYSLLAILIKEILGIRSIVKRTLFSKFLERLHQKLEAREKQMSKDQKLKTVLE